MKIDLKMATIDEIRGYSFVLLSAVLFSTLGVIARVIYQSESDPLTVVTFRASVAVGLLFLGLLVFRPDLLIKFSQILGAGLIFWGSSY